MQKSALDEDGSGIDGSTRAASESSDTRTDPSRVPQPPSPALPDRRMFLGYAVSASWVGLAAATGYGTLRYVAPGSSARIASGTVVLGPAVDFPLNSSRVVRFGDRPVLVVRDSHGAFHAVSATCPHLQCVVGYQPSRELIVCGCHEGTFALSGQNVAGPPPSPLATFPVGVIGDVVVLGSST